MEQVPTVIQMVAELIPMMGLQIGERRPVEIDHSPDLERVFTCNHWYRRSFLIVVRSGWMYVERLS